MNNEIFDQKLHEECGVFGVYRRDADLDVVAATYYGLYALQHRGQESCGMAVNDDGVFYKRRELGLVNEVFTKDVLESMPRGNMCIGHCRYATTGVPVRANAQPFVCLLYTSWPISRRPGILCRTWISSSTSAARI